MIQRVEWDGIKSAGGAGADLACRGGGGAHRAQRRGGGGGHPEGATAGH